MHRGFDYGDLARFSVLDTRQYRSDQPGGFPGDFGVAAAGIAELRTLAGAPDWEPPRASEEAPVSDLDRALAFYRDLLGFEVTTMYGDQAAFLSAGGYHHHIGLNTWHSKGAPPASRQGVGLYHTAIRYPTRKDLAVILDRIATSKAAPKRTWAAALVVVVAASWPALGAKWRRRRDL